MASEVYQESNTRYRVLSTTPDPQWRLRPQLKWCKRGQHWRNSAAFRRVHNLVDGLATTCRDCDVAPPMPLRQALIAEARRWERPGPVRHDPAQDCLHCRRIARETR